MVGPRREGDSKDGGELQKRMGLRKKLELHFLMFAYAAKQT